MLASFSINCTFQHRYICPWCFEASLKELYLNPLLLHVHWSLSLTAELHLKSPWNILFEFKVAVDLGNTCEMPSMWWELYLLPHKSIITIKTHNFRKKYMEHRKSQEINLIFGIWIFCKPIWYPRIPEWKPQSRSVCITGSRCKYFQFDGVRFSSQTGIFDGSHPRGPRPSAW